MSVVGVDTATAMADTAKRARLFRIERLMCSNCALLRSASAVLSWAVVCVALGNSSALRLVSEKIELW
jgi:hypothetical protein